MNLEHRVVDQIWKMWFKSDGCLAVFLSRWTTQAALLFNDTLVWETLSLTSVLYKRERDTDRTNSTLLKEQKRQSDFISVIIFFLMIHIVTKSKIFPKQHFCFWEHHCKNLTHTSPVKSCCCHSHIWIWMNTWINSLKSNCNPQFLQAPSLLYLNTGRTGQEL